MALIHDGRLKAFTVHRNGEFTKKATRIGMTAFDSFIATRRRNDQEAANIRSGCVYFVECGRFTKIGYSADGNLMGRLSALQTANPEPLKIWATMPGDLVTERDMHAMFAHFRRSGEWFELTEDAKWRAAEIIAARNGKITKDWGNV
jgi:hypothetical protein